jgi:DNA-binding LytR/AlgR family response regulator
METIQETGANFLLEGKIIRLDFMDITHIGIVGGITKIYTRSKKYSADYRVSELLSRLPADRFMRINREYIVGFSHVDRVENYVVYVGRYRLFVNYFYRSRLLAALEKHESGALIRISK